MEIITEQIIADWLHLIGMALSDSGTHLGGVVCGFVVSADSCSSTSSLSLSIPALPFLPPLTRDL